MSTRIAVIPGDGIGVDVTREAVKVLNAVVEASGDPIEMVEYDYGADRYLETGVSLPDGALEELAAYDAILVGALGDPRVPDMKHAADILLGMRFKLDLYVNHRPVNLLADRLTPLKDRTQKDIDFVVFRENTEGLYVGMGGNFKKGTADEVAIQEDVNTRKGVERIVRHAFEFARRTGRKSVVMSDKANVLTYAHDLWQRVFKEVGAEYSDLEQWHLYVDALTMQMVKNPAQFDVIVTCNMFGDIVTDLGAQISGGLGLAASGNVHPGKAAMFEPVHGSAPKYAGRNIANPLGAILTAQMLLAHIGRDAGASWVDRAVRRCISLGQTTRDLGGELGTAEAGDAVARAVSAEAAGA